MKLIQEQQSDKHAPLNASDDANGDDDLVESRIEVDYLVQNGLGFG